MAGYSGISAISTFKLRLKMQLCEEKGVEPPKVNEKFKKIFLTTWVNKFRVPVLLDSGSDVCVIQISLLKRLLGGGFSRTFHSAEGELTSFSSHVIKIKGEVDLSLSFNKNSVSRVNKFFVIEDIPDIPCFLIGDDFLRKYQGIISYFSDDNVPRVILMQPVKESCEVMYENMSETRLCGNFVNILPQETLSVTMYLNPAACVLRTDYILITSLSLDNVMIIPSRSELHYCQKNKTFSATACLKNVSSTPFSGNFYGKFELINKCDSVPLSNENSEHILTLMQKYPLAREILNPTCSEKIFLPVHMISVGSLSKNPEYVNDFEQTDTLYGDTDPYGGEAPITEDLVDPSGIELPTQIFKDAQEAINLDSFPSEIRPLIKKIFIDRYPNCVSLHSLDAGNLSLTLGYVKLRLRPGEILPRSKRIFHISPSDRRHLSDIIEFFNKVRICC
jgi:hypothetical protein